MNTKPVPVPGKLLNAIITQTCDKPEKEMPDMPMHSVAIGQNGIAATDGTQAIVVGEVDDLYVPTDRKSALVEAFRAATYRDTCEFESIDRMCDEATGEPKKFPNVAAVLENMNRMVHVADFNPELLKRAAQVAVAAGATSISIYHVPSGDYSLLGFAFNYRIDVDQLTFDFEDREQTDRQALYASIPCKAVIASQNKKRRVDNEVEVHKTKDETFQQAFETLTKDGSVQINDVKITSADDLKTQIEAMFQPKDEEDDKKIFFEAVAFVMDRGQVSTSMLQRKYSIGFQRAKNLVDKMEKWGIIGEQDGPKPRQVIVTVEELNAMLDKARPLSELFVELLAKLLPGATVSAPIVAGLLSTSISNAKYLIEQLELARLLKKDGNGAMIYRGDA